MKKGFTGYVYHSSKGRTNISDLLKKLDKEEMDEVSKDRIYSLMMMKYVYKRSIKEKIY